MQQLETRKKIKVIVAMIVALCSWTVQAVAADTPMAASELATVPAVQAASGIATGTSAGAVGTSPGETPTCVFKDLVSNEVCPAYATARALEVLGMGDEAVIFVEKDAPVKTAKRDRTSIIASSRIEDAVSTSQIDEDDALLLEREVQELAGIRYEIPTSRREIKKFLGFPESAEIADADWTEMIRVHAERTISMSANASRFLLEQLGLVAGVGVESKVPSPPGETPGLDEGRDGSTTVVRGAEPSPVPRGTELSPDKKQIAILKQEALERSFAPVTTSVERTDVAPEPVVTFLPNGDRGGLGH